MSASLAALRDYVTADTGVQHRADSTVLLSVTHSNLRSTFMELRFDLHVRARAPLRRGGRAGRGVVHALRGCCAMARCGTRGAAG
jgi:hypothetical protein